jgi:FixJ family two-component response regulator
MEDNMSFFQTESPFRDSARSASLVCERLDSSESPQGMPTVFIVDGDKAIGESLAALIAGEGWRSQTFDSAEEFLAHPVELAPGCMILDVSLPGLSGLELQKRAAAKCSYVPAVFLSAIEDIPTTVEAMKAGAVEFLMKPFPHAELLGAVREALERSRLIVAREKQRRAIQRCYASLSHRERQVMALVSSGLLNKEVGCELGISEITVKAHRGQVMRKMRASCLADLVKMAGKLGIAKAREITMLRSQVDRAAWPGSQPAASYAFAQ